MFATSSAGQRVGEETVIEKGVEPGETVVTEGTLRLVPGSRVQVREPQGPGDPGGGRRVLPENPHKKAGGCEL